MAGLQIDSTIMWRVSRRLLSMARLSPKESWLARIATRELRFDCNQEITMVHLERLHMEMEDYIPKPVVKPGSAPSSASSSSGGFFSSLFGGGSGKQAPSSDPRATPPLEGLEKVPRGLYMHGGVGCGKSMLMDTLYDCSPLEDGAEKKRLHFLEFMLDVHKRMHELRKNSPDMGDPMPYLAYDIASSTQLLCFDEFQVTDVADALVICRLFRYLFAHGLVMVATSNRHPNQLYLNGIQRESFLPFIDDVMERCETHNLLSGVDYRSERAVSEAGGIYLHPLTPLVKSKVDTLFKRLTKGAPAPPQTLRLRGRELEVPTAANSVARFSFDALCGRPLGAEDYLGIASAFHTVIVEDMPGLTYR